MQVSTLGASGGKSLSQADLLSTETLIRQAAASQRRSLHDLRHTDYLHDMMLPGRGAGDPMLPHHHLMPPHHHHPAGPVRHRVSQQSQLVATSRKYFDFFYPNGSVFSWFKSKPVKPGSIHFTVSGCP